jgi:1,3-propanediol dehydrogenase
MDKYIEIAKAMGAKVDRMTPREAAEKAISMVEELARDVKIPSGLAELGLPEEVIPELSKNAVKDACFITNPRDADVEDIAEIFYSALQKK